MLIKCDTYKKSEGRTLLGPKPPEIPVFSLDFYYILSNTRVHFAGLFYVKAKCGKNEQMLNEWANDS